MQSILGVIGTLLMLFQTSQVRLPGIEVAVPPIIGEWRGNLSPAPGQSIPLILHVAGPRDHPTATLDSPDQGAVGLPVTSVVQDGATFQFDMAAFHASFTAVCSADGRTLTGTWSQGGVSLPLTMVLTAQAIPALQARPQTPRPPFPYRSEEVAYENPVSHAHLAGTLTLPSGSGPFPAVLLVTGSGMQDRDETIFGHKPFLLWADTLTRRGIAVLRVDDRQMGGSTGDLRTATTADFARDAEAGVVFLRSRREIDRRRVGLIGHSEGALIAAMVAAKDSSIAFIVMLAGSGEIGERLLLEQKRLIETAQGVPAETVEQSANSMRQLYEAVKNAPDQATADAALKAAWRAVTAQDGQSDDSMPVGLERTASPWMRWFLRYDPQPTLAQVRCPVLAVSGAKDLQVAPDSNIVGITSALHSNPDATVVKLPGLNHLLQTAATGQPIEYGQIQETISPLALKTVGDWVVDRSRSKHNF